LVTEVKLHVHANAVNGWLTGFTGPRNRTIAIDAYYAWPSRLVEADISFTSSHKWRRFRWLVTDDMQMWTAGRLDVIKFSLRSNELSRAITEPCDALRYCSLKNYLWWSTWLVTQLVTSASDVLSIHQICILYTVHRSLQWFSGGVNCKLSFDCSIHLEVNCKTHVARNSTASFDQDFLQM